MTHALAMPTEDASRYFAPLPSDYAAAEDAVKAQLSSMARAIVECLSKAKLNSGDKSLLVQANRWARLVAAAEDYDVAPGHVLAFRVGERVVVGPSRKGAHKLATILWNHRDCLSPDDRPISAPGAYRDR